MNNDTVAKGKDSVTWYIHNVVTWYIHNVFTVMLFIYLSITNPTSIRTVSDNSRRAGDAIITGKQMTFM